MREQTVEIVERILDRWGKGDFLGGAEELDPYVVFVVRPPFPEPAVVVGPAEISRYMQEFLKQWTELSIEATEFKPIGDTVLVSAVQRGMGTTSGVPVEIPYSQLFTFRGGKILRIEAILDRDEALEAAGLSE